MSKKLTVFVSGQGSLLEAFIDSGVKVDLVLSDRPCRGIRIAKKNNIVAIMLKRKDFTKSFDRQAYSQEILNVINEHKINIIAMAGFMTILSPEFFEKFQGDILNTHPSLLPDYKGHNAVEQALQAKVAKTGCTIHRATAELDSGEIIAQDEVPILPGDTEESLHERIKQKERVLYPKVLKSFFK